MRYHEKRSLPRLAPEWYQGKSFVFWTHTMQGRASGWLTETFHVYFREVLLHVAARYQLICPVYCLMPDHFHLIWIGLSSESDQLIATRFFRRFLSLRLGGYRFQSQAHDHVLREEERERNAFIATCHYILDNPIRAGLCADRSEYRFLGSAALGYPDFDPRQAGYWDRFWNVYQDLLDQASLQRHLVRTTK